jgi:hypothetical protein
MSWRGPGNTSGTGDISVSTQATGTFSYALWCQVGECLSKPAEASVWVWGNPLLLVAPDFDCGTNQLTVRTTGGNGQPIEYHVPSVTQGWTTTNPVTVQAKHFKKEKLKLSARQWNLVRNDYDLVKLDYQLPACGSARQGASDEEPTPLTVVVLGNPVPGREVSVEVRGAAGRLLRLQLTDLKGQVVSERRVDEAGLVEHQVLLLGAQAPGLLLLRVSTPTQNQTVKVLRAE